MHLALGSDSFLRWPGGGRRICGRNVETATVRSERPQPLPRQPIPDLPRQAPRLVGAVRLPIAGPYRPWARLYLRANGSVDWTVRLWVVDRPVTRHVDTETLRTFARVNGLGELARELERLLERVVPPRRP